MDRYEEALSRARKLYNEAKANEYTSDMEDYEFIFPELKESEDEQHRKWILEYLYDGLRKSDEQFKGQFKAAIAWLEKQGEQKPYGQRQECVDCQFNYAGECKGSCAVKRGEQKPANKVEPKFKVGDWITNGKLLVGQVTSFDGEYYHYIQEGIEQPLHISNAYNWHLWTIEDAKDGDVLVYGDNPNDHHVEVIMIFKSLKNERFAFTHFHIFDDEFRTDDWCDCGENVHPATEEQRNLLFQKMTELGYEWDAEKKELKKIDMQELVEQKSAWSEEDEITRKALINLVEMYYGGCFDKTEKNRLLNFLKSPKERVGCEVNCTTTKKWSEEDEEMLNSIIARLHSHPNVGLEEYSKEYNWLNYTLKSLRPQNRWKPSYWQIKAIKDAIKHYNSLGYNYNASILKGLLNELEKLKG